jgi:hypothetical protein
MHEPMLLQHECLLPLEELEAVLPGLLDEFAQLASRQFADRRERMNTNPE